MKIGLQNGKGTVELADASFGAAFNEPLVHQVVTAYLAARRAGTKAQKSRSDVRGGGINGGLKDVESLTHSHSGTPRKPVRVVGREGARTSVPSFEENRNGSQASVCVRRIAYRARTGTLASSVAGGS